MCVCVCVCVERIGISMGEKSVIVWMGSVSISRCLSLSLSLFLSHLSSLFLSMCRDVKHTLRQRHTVLEAALQLLVFVTRTHTHTHTHTHTLPVDTV